MQQVPVHQRAKEKNGAEVMGEGKIVKRFEYLARSRERVQGKEMEARHQQKR